MIWLINWLKKFKSDIDFFELKVLMFLMKYFERWIAILLIAVSNNYSVWWPALCGWPVVRKNDNDAKDPQRWCSWKKWDAYFWAIAGRGTEITTFELITVRILKLEDNDDNVDQLMTARILGLGGNGDNVDRLMTTRGRRSKITVISKKTSCSVRIVNANAKKTSKIWCFDDIVMNEMIW